MTTLQSAILALQHFWAERGCLLAQPYYTQVGAGTMNPATFLRVLGPEPWRVAYVEPSIRPDDGRFGENPNRMQQHTQFQVILKPDPGNPQELYLESLTRLGIDPSRHDLRFVEDNWHSPALGAWGLGWEVWLDGQEITQFTYFQQAGGQILEPVSIEITYGLERILMTLQGVDHFKDVAWNEQWTYGDVNLQAEREHSRYYFEVADVERLRVLFDEYEAEAGSALAAGLVLPAYDYLLKCSHTFNVMDTRGAVGVTERASLFGRMRDLSRRIAEAYLAQRRELGFPWLKAAEDRGEAGRQASDPLKTGGAPQRDRVVAEDSEKGTPPNAPATFLLEVGTEELPAGDLDQALTHLAEALPDLLAEGRLSHGEITVEGTPRRLAVRVAHLAPLQSEVTETVKGPPEARAFDADGNPTPAAIGWAKKQGLPVEAAALRRLVTDLDGGRYLVYTSARPGSPTSDVLAGQVLPRLLSSLTFDRAMRWRPSSEGEPDGAATVSFSRPIRWLLAMHAGMVVPFRFAGLISGRGTRVLRFQTPETFQLAEADAYAPQMGKQHIVLDPAERRKRIGAQAARLAAQVQGQLQPDETLLAEVANLVEAPSLVLGSFDPDYLRLPDVVLIGVMKKHQRYFPVHSADGSLLPHFVAVANGSYAVLDDIRRGNENVLKARFSDAAYFVRRDQESPLEAFLPRLAGLTFQAKLGSMLDKVQRLERLTAWTSAKLGLSETDRKMALRAAHLAKADLATAMVVEMTSLQGEMGRYYALQSGESEPVTRAILEHHQPRSAGDSIPTDRVSLAVGLADRLDTLIGLIAAGLQPSGTRDPFGLRRTAIGLIQILVVNGLPFDLREALTQAAANLPIPAGHEAIESCLGFLAARQEALLLGNGKRFDVVASVLAAQAHNPAGASLAVDALERATGSPDWPATLQAFARCVRILRGLPADPGASGRLTHPAESALDAALKKAEAGKRRPGSVEDFLEAMRPLVPAITAFFEDVLVMSEDRAERRNRLALVRRVAALADGVADLSRLEGF
jgi:glycyl-tRNA synthetase